MNAIKHISKKRKLFKILAIFFGIVFIGLASLITYVKYALPDIGPAPELKVTATPEMVRHGE